VDFRQIEAYVKVIELASFSKAAEAIFLSQPSVSTYVGALEKELGAVLINRSTKEVSPTPAGKIFYENAKELLSLKHNTAERIKNLSGNFSGEIDILASTVPAQYILPELLARFGKMYPNICFNVKQAGTGEIYRGIVAQKAEIGFSGGVDGGDRCEFYEFMTEKLVFIAPQGGFLDAKDYDLEELLYGYPFIAREKGSGTRAQYENFFVERGVDISKINIRAGFDNTQSIINAVANGMGISVVSEFAADVFMRHNMVTAVKLKTPLPERKFYYMLKRNFVQSHLVGLFAEFLGGKRCR